MGWPALKTPDVAFTVQGKEMQYEPKKNQSDVIGNARASRTFPSKTASQKLCTQTLTADHFHINFVDAVKESIHHQPSQDIDTITANGNVDFQHEDLNIKADSCIYDCKTNIITCEHNIILTKGQNTLKGDKAEANLESGCYTVAAHNKSDKVQAVLIPHSVRD